MYFNPSCNPVMSAQQHGLCSGLCCNWNHWQGRSVSVHHKYWCNQGVVKIYDSLGVATVYRSCPRSSHFSQTEVKIEEESGTVHSTVNFGYNDVPPGKRKRSLLCEVSLSEVHISWHYVHMYVWMQNFVYI